MARARSDFDRQNAVGVEEHRGSTPAETLDRLLAASGRTVALEDLSGPGLPTLASALAGRA